MPILYKIWKLGVTQPRVSPVYSGGRSGGGGGGGSNIAKSKQSISYDSGSNQSEAIQFIGPVVDLRYLWSDRHTSDQ